MVLSWAILEPSWVIWEPPWAVLEPSWGYLRPSCCQGAIFEGPPILFLGGATVPPESVARNIKIEPKRETSLKHRAIREALATEKCIRVTFGLETGAFGKMVGIQRGVLDFLCVPIDFQIVFYTSFGTPSIHRETRFRRGSGGSAPRSRADCPILFGHVHIAESRTR